MEDVFELAGKVAIVWGGGQGIGDTLPVDGGWMAEYLIRRMW